MVAGDLDAASGRAYAFRVRSSSPPGSPVTSPDVAATVRLLHRRQGWGRTAVTSFIVFLLGAGAYSSAKSEGTPPPSWFLVIVIVLGAVTIAGIVAAAVDTLVLECNGRHTPPGVPTSHMDEESVRALAAAHPGTRLILTHLGEQVDTVSLAGTGVIIPDDFERLSV